MTPIPLRPDISAALPLLGDDAEQAGGGLGERHHLVGEVDRALRRLMVAERREAGADDLLQVALARVDDVDHPLAAAEGGVLGGALDGRRPEPLLFPPAVAEVLAEQAELPELVGDVLADVGHRAVGAHDHLVGILETGELRGVGERHHPAAGVLALALELHRAGGLQQLEGDREEVERRGCRSRGSAGRSRCRAGPSSSGGGRRCGGRPGGRSRPAPPCRSRARAGWRGAAPGGPGPPRTSARPGRRDPSSGSRRAPAGRRSRRCSCARCRRSRPPRPPPGRRCRRCSSAPRPGGPGPAGSAPARRRARRCAGARCAPPCSG